MCCTGECCSLELFHFVNLTSSCSLIPLEWWTLVPFSPPNTHTHTTYTHTHTHTTYTHTTYTHTYHLHTYTPPTHTHTHTHTHTRYTQKPLSKHTYYKIQRLCKPFWTREYCWQASYTRFWIIRPFSIWTNHSQTVKHRAKSSNMIWTKLTAHSHITEQNSSLVWSVL